jgi:hypothetical protein
MKVQSDDVITKERLDSAFQVILNNANEQLKERINRTALIITDENKAKTFYDDGFGIFEKAYLNGFGGVKGNIRIPILSNDPTSHLVVLNMQNIQKLGVNDVELSGILAHELGHIFNDAPVDPIPSFLNGATVNSQNEVKTINRKNKEFYADYFAKSIGLTDNLVSSLEKFINSPVCTNKIEMRERVGKLTELKQAELVGRQI